MFDSTHRWILSPPETTRFPSNSPDPPGTTEVAAKLRATFLSTRALENLHDRRTQHCLSVVSPQEARPAKERSEKGEAQRAFIRRDGTLVIPVDCRARRADKRRNVMNGLIYLVGLVVVIMAILSFFGLR